MKNLTENNLYTSLSGKDIYLYGASNTGRLCLQELQKQNFHIKYFIDDTPTKIGRSLESIEIISFDQFYAEKSNDDKIALIITSTYAKVIEEKLKSHGITDAYIMFDLIWPPDKIKLNKWQTIFEQRISELQMAGLDDKSNAVYHNILEYLKSANSERLIEIATAEECYFTAKVLAAMNNRSVSILDAGAHDGDLIRSLDKHNINVAAWYCFEPDPANFQKLLANRELYRQKNVMECINQGLWDEETELHFQLHDGGTNSKITEPHSANMTIKVTTIDKELKGKEINFIKMDIEGAELKALKGGIKTIQHQRPILAISIYHSPDDFFDIFLYLKNNLQDYYFEIKQHAITLSETVLYAYPA